MAGGESVQKNLRVNPQNWEDFGKAVGDKKRSAWFIDFMDAVNHAPQRWRDFRAIAEARGDTFASALVKAITLYRDAE